MKNVRQTNLNIHRDSWVEINIGNLAHNAKEIRKNVPSDTKLLAVVKADSYGHGSVMLAPTLLVSGFDMLGVASIDEGVDLRNAKINCEILVLGAVPVWAVETAVQEDISIPVFSDAHLEACHQAYLRTGQKPKVHVKIDTGMNRIGIGYDRAIDFIKKVQSSDFVDLKGIFTHLAVAEDREKTQIQIDRWNNVISNIDTTGLLLHIQNTVGTMCYDIPLSNSSVSPFLSFNLFAISLTILDLCVSSQISKSEDNPSLSKFPFSFKILKASPCIVLILGN